MFDAPNMTGDICPFLIDMEIQSSDSCASHVSEGVEILIKNGIIRLSIDLKENSCSVYFCAPCDKFEKNEIDIQTNNWYGRFEATPPNKCYENFGFAPDIFEENK